MIKKTPPLHRKIIDILESRKGERLTPKRIAELLLERFPEDMEKKKENSNKINSDLELHEQVTREVYSHREQLEDKYKNFSYTGSRPMLFYWSDKTDAEEADETSAKITVGDGSRRTPSEKELYPILADYLTQEHRIYSLRIEESKSSNKRGSGGNKWLYPDIVGLDDLTTTWHESVVGLVEQNSDNRANLYSFEVKVTLNRSNVREAYFQAVSNSSWANFGYLVTSEIQRDETTEELRMLFGLHGIGVILLDLANVAESQILIPARQRQNVDWSTCSRLAIENPDFRRFLTAVKEFLQTGNPGRGNWYNN